MGIFGGKKEYHGGRPASHYQQEVGRALQRLTGKEHTLYRPYNSFFITRETYVTMDGRKFTIRSDEGGELTAEWD